MPNNTLFKMFFKNLFTCFFITWILATCSIEIRWRGWSLCKLFHSYYESLFMSMYDKQTKCCGCVTSHSQQIGQPPCLALTDLWTSKQCLKYFTSGNKNGSVLFLTRKCIWNQPSLKFPCVFITHNKVTSIAPSYLSLNRQGFYYELKRQINN